MPEYRLVSTRRNRDGSFDTPTMEHLLEAADDAAAIKQAGRFPIDGFGDVVDVAWLTDEAGTVIWSFGQMDRAA